MVEDETELGLGRRRHCRRSGADHRHSSDRRKSQIADIRHELDRQPSPEEFDKLREKVDQINDRMIRIESRFDE